MTKVIAVTNAVFLEVNESELATTSEEKGSASAAALRPRSAKPAYVVCTI